MRGNPGVIDISKSYHKEDTRLAQEVMFPFDLTEKRIQTGPVRRGTIWEEHEHLPDIIMRGHWESNEPKTQCFREKVDGGM